ncbi:MAG: alpha/beta fold hydrolase [Opitutales bacterium]|nr:alpha/beta fold hydrolase [Opitutales bacterium]MCH8541122.1 alpha/beta fold hydrolase [Opitutales bacterium]
MISPKTVLSVLAIAIALPLLGVLVASAVFSWRASQWEDRVTRTEAGVLTFAEPFEKGPEDAQTAFLLVHGFADTPDVWQPLAGVMAERGFRVRAMRLPGWGEPMQEKRQTGLADWEKAIIEEAAVLRDQYESFYIVGHSLGGGLVAKLAGEGRLEAEGIILYAPLFDITSVRSPILPVRAWYNLGRVILPGGMTLENIYGDHALVAEPRPPEKRDPFFPRRYLNDLYQLVDYHATHDFSSEIPVHLVLPGEDAVVENEAAEHWLDRVPGHLRTLRRVEEAGHVVPLEFEPEEELERLHEWTESQP